MSSSKYPIFLSIQLFVLALDVVFNLLSVLLYGRNIMLLMTFILQDSLSIICLLMLVISFSSTFVFQVGLIGYLLKVFSPAIIFTSIYIVLSIMTHYFLLSYRWEVNAELRPFTAPLIVLYVVHKYFAALYYSSYKRAALLLSNPKYFSDSPWLRKKIQETK